MLAGIVVSDVSDDSDERYAVVSLGAGTKFMLPQVASQDFVKAKIRDSHAEVVCRRALKGFLHREVFRALTQPGYQSQVLQRETHATFRVCPNLAFHSYVSTAPCGGASAKSDGLAGRVFLKTAVASGKKKVTDPNTPAGCHLRKLSSHTSTMHTKSLTNSKDCLSCSDKVLKWQTSALQGKLLSHFLPNPLALATIVIGHKFHRERCQKSLCCRACRAGDPD